MILSPILSSHIEFLGAFSEIILHFVGFTSIVLVLNHFMAMFDSDLSVSITCISVLQLADIMLSSPWLYRVKFVMAAYRLLMNIQTAGTPESNRLK